MNPGSLSNLPAIDSPKRHRNAGSFDKGMPSRRSQKPQKKASGAWQFTIMTKPHKNFDWGFHGPDAPGKFAKGSATFAKLSQSQARLTLQNRLDCSKLPSSICKMNCWISSLDLLMLWQLDWHTIHNLHGRGGDDSALVGDPPPQPV